ncbi:MULTISPECIES: DUF4192 domain-containing protein [unclassified Gordonia (in: high G+C Gram-positive bacteria)]
MAHQPQLSPTGLLTAIPALLGFIPRRSLILVALADATRVDATMRHDLDLRPDGRPTPAMTEVISNLGDILENYGATTVVAVVCDDRYGADDAHYRRIIAIVDRHCGGSAGLAAGYVVPCFESGAIWRRVWHCGTPDTGTPDTGTPDTGSDDVGRLRDPRTSPTAVAGLVENGRPVLGERDEMRRMLEPTEHCDGDCHAADCDGRRADCDDRAGIPGGQAESSAELLAAILEALTTPFPRFDCATVARLDRAIRDLRVRDAALAFAVTDLRHAAESLWRELCRRLTGTGRASAATLLAHLHYIGGEGAHAAVALDCALEADPTWYFAVLLDSALRRGMRPHTLWQLIDDSYAMAARLGLDIPRATLRDAG